MSVPIKKKEVSPVKKPWWQRIRFVYRPSSTLAKTVVLSAIILSTVTLLTIHGVIQGVRLNTEAAREEAARQQQENEEWKDKIDNLGSQDSVEDIAKDELGLVDPNTQVIKPQQ